MRYSRLFSLNASPRRLYPLVFAALGLVACGGSPASAPGVGEEGASTDAGSASADEGGAFSTASNDAGDSGGVLPPAPSGDAGTAAGDGGAFDSPDAMGPIAVDIHLAQSVTDDGSLYADYYLPQGHPGAPIVFLRHGFTRSPQNLAGWGKLLASHGFAVALPSTSDSLSGPTGAADLVTAVNYTLTQAKAATGSFLSGAIDPSKVVLGGHSSGGLAATLAAEGSPFPVVGLVLLDTEADPAGEAAAPKLRMPSVGAFAEPDNSSGDLSCNEQGGGVRTVSALGGPVLAFRVKNATHCDLESDTDDFCLTACGQTSPDHLAAFETYVTAFLELAIRCDARAKPWVEGSTITSDSRVTVLAQTSLSALCP